MEHPLVSVILPVYNGEQYLADALNSIFAQDYRPIEVIVVDDGSVDATVEIAQSYPEVRYIYQVNQGHGAAKNTGLAAAKGTFVAFLDADDKWTPNKLSKQVGYLLEHPQVGYTISRMHVFLEEGTEWPPELNKAHLQKDPPAYIPSAMVVRKSVFNQVGTFDASYRHANDSDWLFRAKDIGIPMAIIPEVLLYRRIHSANLSHETSSMSLDLLRVVRSSIQRKQKSQG